MNFSNTIDYCSLYGNAIYNTYYKNMVNSGFVANLSLFDEKCNCSINNLDYVGAYNVLIKLAESNIHRFNYLNLSGSCQYVSQGVLINVTGKCQIISLNNVIIGEINFSETFLICINKNRIINYIGKYFL